MLFSLLWSVAREVRTLEFESAAFCYARRSYDISHDSWVKGATLLSSPAGTGNEGNGTGEQAGRNEARMSPDPLAVNPEGSLSGQSSGGSTFARGGRTSAGAGDRQGRRRGTAPMATATPMTMSR